MSAASGQPPPPVMKPNPQSKEDLSNITPENSSFTYCAAPVSRSPGEGNTPNDSFADNFSFATQQFLERYEQLDDDGWSAIARDIRERVEQSPLPVSTSDVQFYLYPGFPSEVLSGRNQPPEEPGLVKLFLGNMRFEMGRLTISWCLKKACNIDIPASHILVHFRAPGKPRPSPTGCASIFVPPDDARVLLEYNQRIFCGAKGIYVAVSSDSMQALIHERKIVETAPDGHVRGTKHAMVIEQSRPVTQNASFAQLSFTSQSTFTSSRQDSASSRISGTFQQPSVDAQQQQAIYFKYPGPPAEDQPPEVALENPIEFFVGGICYEATAGFVAWMLSLSGVRVSPQNVTLFQDHRTGSNTGCAMVKVESPDFPRIHSFHHRMLCDSKGVFVSDVQFVGVQAFLRKLKAKGDPPRGPTHAVVIERRRAQPTPPPGYTSDLHAQAFARDGPPPPYVHHTRTFSFPLVTRPMFTQPPSMPATLPKPTYLNKS